MQLDILLALEMDYLRRSPRVSRLQQTSNTIIRNKMEEEQPILEKNMWNICGICCDMW